MTDESSRHLPRSIMGHFLYIVLRCWECVLQTFKREAGTKITLEPSSDKRDRIDYLLMLLDKDQKWIEIIDGHRNRNLAHALVAFAGVFVAALKFFRDINPWLISIPLTLMAFAFFLRDVRLHQYCHGWNETIKAHMRTLSDVINKSNESVQFHTYYQSGEKLALRFSEWLSPNRLAYYILLVGGIMSFLVFKFDWVTKMSTNK